MSYVNLLDIIYPIGSIYLNEINVSPAETVGGTWTAITNALLGSQVNELVGYNGAWAITIDQMPEHTHMQYVTANSGNKTIFRQDWNKDVPSGLNIYPQLQTGPAGGGQTIIPAIILLIYGCELHNIISRGDII